MHYMYDYEAACCLHTFIIRSAHRRMCCVTTFVMVWWIDRGRWTCSVKPTKRTNRWREFKLGWACIVEDDVYRRCMHTAVTEKDRGEKWISLTFQNKHMRSSMQSGDFRVEIHTNVLDVYWLQKSNGQGKFIGIGLLINSTFHYNNAFRLHAFSCYQNSGSQ